MSAIPELPWISSRGTDIPPRWIRLLAMPLRQGERLRAYGLEAAEILCDEWNYIEPVPEFWTKYRQEGSEYLQQELFEKQKSRFGASFLASCFVEMQNSPLSCLQLL